MFQQFLIKEWKVEFVKTCFFVNEMLDKNICHNVVTYTALIDYFSKKGNLKEAIKLFHEMPRKNICSSALTYNILIDSCLKEGKWKEATKVLHERIDKGCNSIESHTML